MMCHDHKHSIPEFYGPTGVGANSRVEMYKPCNQDIHSFGRKTVFLIDKHCFSTETVCFRNSVFRPRNTVSRLKPCFSPDIKGWFEKQCLSECHVTNTVSQPNP